MCGRLRVDEVAKYYEGEIILAKDGTEYVLP
jgi:hypothetical protein